MKKSSPDYRIEAVLAATIKRRRQHVPLILKFKERSSLEVCLEVCSGNSLALGSHSSVSDEYLWGSRGGDWSLKAEESEDLLNLNAFFDKVKLHLSGDI